MKPTSSMILVANRTRALLFKRSGAGEHLALINSFECPEGRIAKHETTTDRPGTVYSSSPGGHAHSFAEKTNAADEIAVTFARSLSEQIERLDSQERFDYLVLVAEPHMLGILKAEMGKQSAKRVTSTITKDLASLDESEIRERLLASGAL